jgi:hypothetical protein
MPEPLRPAPAKLYTRENWFFVPTIASETLAPTVAEMTAAAALDLTNMVYAETAPNPETSTEMVKQERRLGDDVNYEYVGPQEITGGQITMSFDQQGAALSDSVKAWEKFSPGGVTGFMVNRQNVPKATDVTAGQFLHVYPAEVSKAVPARQGEGPSAEGAMICAWAVTGRPAYKVAVLA